jgi:hypothetical protein
MSQSDARCRSRQDQAHICSEYKSQSLQYLPQQHSPVVYEEDPDTLKPQGKFERSQAESFTLGVAGIDTT